MCLRKLALVALLPLLAAPAFAQQKAITLSIDGVIHPITVEIVKDAIRQAQDEHAEVLLVRLNTPGGLLDATRQIIQELCASPVPVITYVTPSGARAASAGFFLLEAGDVAAMSPGTNTGAASPVLLSGQMDDVMRKKVENDAAALLRSLTSRRGRNSELAEQTVRDAKAFTEKEALDQKLVEIDRGRRAAAFQTTGWARNHALGRQQAGAASSAVSVTEARQTWRERLMATIADPNIGIYPAGAGGAGNLCRIHVARIDLCRRFRRHPVSAGTFVAIHPAHQLGGRGAAAAVRHAVRAGSEVHVARRAGHRRDVSMVLGALLLVNGPPEVRIHLSTAIGGRGSVWADHDVPGGDRGPGAAQQGADRRERDDRRDRGKPDPVGTRRPSPGAWRVLGCGGVQQCSGRGHVRVKAVAGLKLKVEAV